MYEFLEQGTRSFGVLFVLILVFDYTECHRYGMRQLPCTCGQAKRQKTAAGNLLTLVTLRPPGTSRKVYPCPPLGTPTGPRRRLMTSWHYGARQKCSASLSRAGTPTCIFMRHCQARCGSEGKTGQLSSAM
ncbi:hypothetical protein Y1Q_0012476 [Alligator mississippiensis]|uniref:Uncharacterized protein n=1 Tax=Alligator mississippiensis TaxID=8496 RepID=A0A151M7S3_ALLMI|nr:hypothetical protein Y1Q_0012476 [Alligator mississippiensis]